MRDMKDLTRSWKAEIDDINAKGKLCRMLFVEKTGGLETETEINEAIDMLEADLQAKETERNSRTTIAEQSKFVNRKAGNCL